MYNNKTVIISCAGMGKRLGMGIPKALIEIDGKPLIIRHLEMLEDCPDVRIVVGYKANEVIEVVNKYRKNVTFVFNHDYMNNGTAASVSLASKYANDYIITIDGDVLIHPDDIDKILKHNGNFIGVCEISTDDPVLTEVKDNQVIKFSREKGQYEWTGISQFKSSDFSPNFGHVYQLLEPLLPVDYLLLRIKEIDTPNDYNNANRWVKNNFSNNITIGVVGGMGSIATSDFFRRIIDAFPAEKEWERPRIIVDNRCNMPSRVRAILYKERVKELVHSLTDSIEMMVNNNCDYIILACNTSHVFLEEIFQNNPELKEKILNIINLCAMHLNNDKVKKVKLLASEGTILSNVYSDELSKYNILIDKLDNQDFSYFRNWIEAVKQHNITEEIKKDFINYINNCECDNIILGYTELPILYDLCKNEITKNIYDPLQCVINYLVKEQNKKNK